jgi:coproporphyrinogen III oxidase
MGELRMTEALESRKTKATDWFRSLRDQICAAFEQIETELPSDLPHADLPAKTFERKAWQRPDESDSQGGGGVMSVMRNGRVFEKVGVNISEVHGTFSEQFRTEIPGALESNGKFWAGGISLVAHMRSPKVPAIHMNTRMIVTSKTGSAVARI